jgi:molecular chaperone GrpE (heat shock protein)
MVTGEFDNVQDFYSQLAEIEFRVKELKTEKDDGEDIAYERDDIKEAILELEDDFNKCIKELPKDSQKEVKETWKSKVTKINNQLKKL